MKKKNSFFEFIQQYFIEFYRQKKILKLFFSILLSGITRFEVKIIHSNLFNIKYLLPVELSLASL